MSLLDKMFRRHKRAIGRRWRMDETDIKIKGRWKYLYHTVDTTGQTINFLLTAKRDAATAFRFFRKAIRHHDEPYVVTIDKSGTNTAALATLNVDKPEDETITSGRTILYVGYLKYRKRSVCRLVVVSATEPFSKVALLLPT